MSDQPKVHQTTRYTPGPWTVFCDDTGGEFTGWPSIQAPEHIDTAVVHRAGFKQQYWGDLSQRECIANAHLIAAAPDLLEALKWFIDDIDGTHTVMMEFDENVGRARAAIAKALGKSR